MKILITPEWLREKAKAEGDADCTTGLIEKWSEVLEEKPDTEPKVIESKPETYNDD